MTIAEKIRYLLRKNPRVKFNRGEFWWAWFEEFGEVKVVMGKSQWLEIYKDFSAVDRALRDVLKEPEFKLPPDADAKRYEREKEFIKTIEKPK